MTIRVIRQSIFGISREMEKKRQIMRDSIICYYGDARRFIKPVRSKNNVVEHGLKAYREHKKLSVIREQLKFIYHLETSGKTH